MSGLTELLAMREALDELISDLGRWDRLNFGGTKQHVDGANEAKEAIKKRLLAIRTPATGGKP